jgi:hypothetical protein
MMRLEIDAGWYDGKVKYKWTLWTGPDGIDGYEGYGSSLAECFETISKVDFLNGLGYCEDAEKPSAAIRNYLKTFIPKAQQTTQPS